jgi:hypothetical protein
MGRFLEASGTRGSQAAAVLARDSGIVSNRMDKDETSRIVFQDKVGDRVYLNEQDQWGATASLQFKPSDTFSLSFDAMLGGYDTHEDEYDAAAYSASSRSTLDTIHDYDRDTLSAYGITVLKDVSYTATQHEILSKERNADTDYRQFSSTLDWKVGNWDIDALVGYSGARKDSDYANLKHVAYAPSRTRWTRNGGETVPSTIGGFDMYNAVDKYLFEAYETELEKVKDDKYAAQLDLRRQMNLAFFPALSGVQFGALFDPLSSAAGNCESDGRLYSMCGSGSGSTTANVWLSGGNAMFGEGNNVANDYHAGIFAPGTAVMFGGAGVQTRRFGNFNVTLDYASANGDVPRVPLCVTSTAGAFLGQGRGIYIARDTMSRTTLMNGATPVGYIVSASLIAPQDAVLLGA